MTNPNRNTAPRSEPHRVVALSRDDAVHILDDLRAGLLSFEVASNVYSPES